jgi:Xaa-Pro aminopeptidase
MTYPARIARVREAMRDADIDALCLSLGSDLPYLTGYRVAHANERLTMFVITRTGDSVIVVPTLEAPLVSPVDDAFTMRAWNETEQPIRIVSDILGDAATVAVGSQTWGRFVLGLQEADTSRRWVDAESLMAELRMVKSKNEVDALRAAGATVDRVAESLDDMIFGGRTELDVSREVSRRTTEAGHQSAEFAIVASGPNGASPHHVPSDRVIENGDAIVVDFGGYQDGYCSDTTRNFVVGQPPDGYEEAYVVLHEAQKAATAAVAPGVTTESLDEVAREIIADAGYGDRFIHRLGHGIGLDVHERPYLVEGDTTVLKPGMTFSIEPGIYTPGRWGMRIEDIVAVTETGVESLNRSNRNFRVVA